MMIQSILLFQKPPAFLISNYNTASYLHYIKNQGKQRNKEKDAGKHNLLHPLSAKENKCAESLGLNLTDTSKYEKLVQTFLTNTVARPTEGFPSKLKRIFGQIRRKLCSLFMLCFGWLTSLTAKDDKEDIYNTENLKKKLQTKRTKGDLERILPQIKDSSDVRNLTQNLLYQAKLEESSFEMDLLIILPQSRLIIGKHVLFLNWHYDFIYVCTVYAFADLETKSSRMAENIHRRIEKAASQVRRRARVLGQLHGDILLNNWTYVRAISLPMLSTQQIWNEDSQSQKVLQICSSCRQFILDRDKVNDLVGWIEGLTAARPVYPMDEQYENLLTRIIGFLMVSKDQPAFINFPLHERMQASRKQNDAAITLKGSGVASEEPIKSDVDAFKEPCQSDVEVSKKCNKNKSQVSKEGKKDKGPTHLGSLQTVVLWNKDQLNVLQAEKKKLILDSDFGCGKTLLLKACAKSLKEQQDSKREAKVDIIFFSFTAARTQVEEIIIFIVIHFNQNIF